MEKIHKQAKRLFLATIILVAAGVLLALDTSFSSFLMTPATVYVFYGGFLILGILVMLFALSLPFRTPKTGFSPSRLHKVLFSIPFVSVPLAIIPFFVRNLVERIPACDLFEGPTILESIVSSAGPATLLAPYALTFGGAFIAFVVYFYRARKDQITLTTFYMLSSLLVVLIFLGAVWFSTLNMSRAISHDAHRISDLRQAQLALELYHDISGSYPISTGNSPNVRWQSLDVLVEEDVMSQLPMDPCVKVSPNKAGARQYDYQSAPDGTSYVLKAVLSDTNHTALSVDSDLDGIIYDISCGESGNEHEYCIGPR